MQAPDREKDHRRDWIIVLLIILIGFFCILCAGTWALRLTPSWKLDSNMESNLDPNSDFLTARSIGVIEPIDISILTKPAWMDLYLTPGATFETSAPIPTTVQNTPLPPVTRTPTSIPTTFPTLTRTATPAIIIYPTNTSVSIPPTRTFTPAGPSANLRITLTDNSATYTPGSTLTYTIVVYNTTGPSAVIGATVADTFPAALSGITWTCIGTSGGVCPANGTGNINHTVNLPVGSFVTYTVNATINPGATGNLVNTATVTAPAGVTDPVLTNNTATDTDTQLINADLRITKTDGAATYVPGTTTTYTIVVTNAGPANVTGATVTDTFPAGISASWTCAAGGGAACVAANGTSDLNHTLNIPAGGTLTYTVSAAIDPSVTGNLTNTATVSPPAGTTDSSPLNNSATDTDTPVYNVNLQITKTDGVNTYLPGTTTTYTIIVSNAGPSDAVGATVTDTFPAQVTSANWSCSAVNGAACQLANGTGNISQTVNVPVGGTLTYTATVNISALATGPMSNTATITAPAGYNETNNSDNSALDVDAQAAISADLSITKTSPTTAYSAGSIVTYTITVTNNGPNNVTGATINDAKPAQINTWGWCVAPCVPSATTGADLSTTVNLASGASITYSVFANVLPNATGNLVNTATVTAPAGVTDPTGNNSATFTDVPYIDLQITKDDGGATTYTAGGSILYTVTVTNASTFDLNGVRVEDAIPSLVTTWGWCVAPCVPAANTSAGLIATINMPAGSSITYNILANIHPNATGDLNNTAEVFPPTGYSDAVIGNNSATDSNINVTGEPEVGPPDGTVFPLGDSGFATFYLSQPIVANGDGAPDFAYHELLVTGTIFLDQLIVEISTDNVTWYQVFFWGNAVPDTNTNVDNLNLPNIAAACPTEADNCPIPPTELYNGTGVTINVDAFAPPGNYYWIRFTEPGITPGDGAHVDSIEILP